MAALRDGRGAQRPNDVVQFLVDHGANLEQRDGGSANTCVASLLPDTPGRRSTMPTAGASSVQSAVNRPETVRSEFRS